MSTAGARFREDQVDEYRDLKKELEQTAKNCRILQFKLRKAERRGEQLENDKHDLEIQIQDLGSTSAAAPAAKPPSSSSAGLDRVHKLEQELVVARDQLQQTQKELQSLQALAKSKNSAAKDAGPVLSKSRSLEVLTPRRSCSFTFITSSHSQYSRNGNLFGRFQTSKVLNLVNGSRSMMEW